MEVAVQHHSQEFQFSSTATSPYGSPRRFGNPFDLHFHYTSAPASPARAAAIYAHFNSISAADVGPLPAPTPRPSSVIPFEWEEKPGTPKSRASTADDSSVDAFDFVFDFSRQLNKEGPLPVVTAADELFEEGHVRPLKPPPRLQHPGPLDDRSSVGAASSPRSPRTLKGLWSPRGRGGVGEEFDPFTTAMVEATRDRGRESRSVAAAAAAAPPISKAPSFSASRSPGRGRKGSRSLSPLRARGVEGAGFLPPAAAGASPKAASKGGGGGGGGGRRWRLRDLLLFRSASEGRVSGNRSKDPMRKFSFLTPSYSSSSLLSPFCHKKLGASEEWNRDLSFRSIDNSRSTVKRERKPVAVSVAHEGHSKEAKKKALPPYGQGLFSCIRLNPTVCSIARGVGSSSFARR